MPHYNKDTVVELSLYNLFLNKVSIVDFFSDLLNVMLRI